MVAKGVHVLKDVKPENIEFEDVHREGSMYTARFKNKISIQSPVVVCKETITNASGEILPYVYITPDAALEKWVLAFDDYILDQADKNKEKWFRKSTSASDIQQTYKSYLRDKTFRLRLTDDVEIFDSSRNLVNPADLKAGTKVKLIMDLGRVSFGRNEWGCVWRASQVMVQNTRGCLFTEDTDDDDVETDVEDFL